MARTPDPLQHFVREALERGESRARIESVLKDAGWEAEPIRMALESYAESDFPLPVPAPRPSVSAREAFYYLAAFAALALTAEAFMALLFGLIDLTLPKPGVQIYREGTLSGIRWSIARIVIALPLLIVMARAIERSILAGRFRINSPARLWIGYVAMFLAGCTLAGDFITLIAYMLDGDLGLRFLLKVLVVAITAGTVLAATLHGLRRAEERG